MPCEVRLMAFLLNYSGRKYIPIYIIYYRYVYFEPSLFFYIFACLVGGRGGVIVSVPVICACLIFRNNPPLPFTQSYKNFQNFPPYQRMALRIKYSSLNILNILSILSIVRVQFKTKVVQFRTKVV